MPALERQGPFSYDADLTSSNNIYTLVKSAYDPTNGEVLEVLVDGEKVQGVGLSVAGTIISGDLFYVNSLTNPTTISLVTASTSAKVTIRRLSNRETPQVDFAPGSVIREQDLDNSTNQTLHVAQEAIDIALSGMVLQASGKFDAKSKVVESVADGVADNDAVNIGQLETHDATITGYKEDTEDYKLETADWAQKVDGAVKVYTDNSVTGSALGYSAKAWTIGGTDITDTAGAGSAKQWAIGGGSSFTVGNKVDGSSGSYSAKYYSNAASASATAASASETAAAASEASANASANAVASVIDNFYDKYLGAMADNATQGTNPTPTGTWIKNSSSITVSANTNIKVGQVVTGTGIPAGANVLSIDGTTVVISDNMDAAGSGVSLTFTGYGVYGTFNSTKDGPDKDNDNEALADGMLYFNTTDDVMMVYDTTSTKWKQLQPTTSEMTAIQTCHTNINDIYHFRDTYQIADFNSGVPSKDGGGVNNLAEGDLAFDTQTGVKKLKVYTGSAWTQIGLTQADTQTEANNASVAMAIALG